MAPNLAVGQSVDVEYEPLYIALSYLVSIVGCWTSLELLHRRTSSKGWYNWYLLIAAAVTMGAVAVWSMHYVGNRALIMANGAPKLQIEYRSGYTAGSFFLPISLVGIAFYTFGVSETVSILWTLTGGFLVGTGICGMHYISQQGIANYALHYSKVHVVGAAMIAVAASTVALGLFFYLTAIWTNSWSRRLACAALLAAAVSGMHWVATVGTYYRLEPESNENGTGVSEKMTALIVLFLALGCCTLLLIFAFVGQRSRTRSATRAKQLVLASATFDEEGRILVTPDGLLPCRKIAKCYLERTFDDTFDVGHPLFCWIFRLSHCWPAVQDLLPSMTGVVRASTKATLWTSGLQQSPPGTATTASNSGCMEKPSGYETLFKQLFCVAANDLAASMHNSLENIGTLFGEILSTGTTLKRFHLKFATRWKRGNKVGVCEAEKGGPQLQFGRGQLLFLVRRVDRSEAARLQAIGYRFADIQHIYYSLAERMETTRQELLPKLVRMRNGAGKEKLLDAGVHLACFAVRPVFRRGFDVLVRRDAKGLLPSIQMPGSKLNKVQLDFLKRLDGMTVSSCLNKLQRMSICDNEEEIVFCHQLFNALFDLTVKVGDPFIQEAKLTARAMIAPCPQVGSGQRLEYASIVAFRAVTDVHSVGTIDPQFEYIPSGFFLAQQRVHGGSPFNERFAQQVLADFGDKVRRADSEVPSDLSRQGSIYSPSIANRNPRFSHPRPITPTRHWPFIAHGDDLERSDSSSIKNLVNVNSSTAASDMTLGGASGAGAVSIEVNEIRHGNSPDMEMSDLGGSKGAVASSLESETFGDELLALTIGERRKPRQNS